MNPSTKTRPLVAGDVYQEGDQRKCKGWANQQWEPISPGLFGHTVLIADFILNDLRRTK